MSVWREEQKTDGIDRDALPGRAAELMKDGYRLVAVTCTTLDYSFELTYSFDREHSLLNLRVVVPNSDPSVPSITDSYFCAFTYENELQDLFGLKVPGLKLDFGGNFYRKAVSAPFRPAGEAK